MSEININAPGRDELISTRKVFPLGHLFILLTFAMILILPACSNTVHPVTANGDEGRLRETVQALQELGERSSFEKQWKAARYIERRFREEGLETEIQYYEYDGKRWPNVIATLEGIPSEKECVMAIAHLDSSLGGGEKEAPGADDNGSGVGVLLQAARNMRGLQLRRKVVFAVFSKEETGQSGSRHFAALAKKDGKEIHAVLNFDILGYAGPRFRDDWDGVWKIPGIRRKIRALADMVLNTVCSLTEGRRVLKVVGKPSNEKLVRASAAEIRRRAHLTVREEVRDDCG